VFRILYFRNSRSVSNSKARFGVNSHVTKDLPWLSIILAALIDISVMFSTYPSDMLTLLSAFAPTGNNYFAILYGNFHACTFCLAFKLIPFLGYAQSFLGRFLGCFATFTHSNSFFLLRETHAGTWNLTCVPSTHTGSRWGASKERSDRSQCLVPVLAQKQVAAIFP